MGVKTPAHGQQRQRVGGSGFGRSVGQRGGQQRSGIPTFTCKVVGAVIAAGVIQSRPVAGRVVTPNGIEVERVALVSVTVSGVEISPAGTVKRSVAGVAASRSHPQQIEVAQRDRAAVGGYGVGDGEGVRHDRVGEEEDGIVADHGDLVAPVAVDIPTSAVAIAIVAGQRRFEAERCMGAGLVKGRGRVSPVGTSRSSRISSSLLPVRSARKTIRAGRGQRAALCDILELVERFVTPHHHRSLGLRGVAHHGQLLRGHSRIHIADRHIAPRACGAVLAPEFRPIHWWQRRGGRCPTCLRPH